MERVILMIASFLYETLQSAGASNKELELLMGDVVQLELCSLALHRALKGLRKEVVETVKFWHNLSTEYYIDLYCTILLELKCLRGELVCPVTYAEFNAAVAWSRTRFLFQSRSPAEQRRRALELVDRFEMALWHEADC